MLLGLIKKELIALTRDVHGLAVLFAMPVLFVIVMSLALKDLYDPPLRTLRHAIQVKDSGIYAADIGRLWATAHGPAVPLPADWQQQLREGKLKYVIVLDEGLSKELAMLAMPTAPSIHLLTEPGLDGNLFNALRAELQAVAGQLKARGALVTLGEPVGPATTDTGKLVSAERFSSGGPRPSAVQQNVAAWLVFGMFFVIAALSNLFIEERRCGALARLRSLGVPPSVLLLSKALPYFGVNLLQAAMMLAVGVWLMPVLGAGALSFARVDLPALLLVVCAISAAAVSLALMLSCLVRTATQAAAVGPVLNVLMAALGGIMVPTFVMPAVMQTIASLSPMNWGLEALLTVLLRGGGVLQAGPLLLRLAGFAALMLLCAWMLFKRNPR